MKDFLKKRGRKLGKTLRHLSSEASDASKQHVKENLIARLPRFRNVRLLVLEWLLLAIIIISLSIAQAFWYTDSYSVRIYASGGGFTEGTLGKINSMNPIFALTNSEKTLSKLLFARLASPDASGHIGPDLAESIKTDAKGKVWTVTLRDRLYWSDGAPITIYDVMFTIGLLKHPKVNSPFSKNFTGVEVSEDNGKVIFTLPSPYSSFSSILDVPILPAHILRDASPELLSEHPFNNRPVTSGPFIFHASQTMSRPGEKIVYLDSNPRYFKGAPLLSTFTVHAFSEIDHIVNAVNSGIITATAELSATDAKRISHPDFYEKQTAISSGVFAFINAKSEILGRKNLRRALQQGIDLRSLRAPLEDESPLDLPVLKAHLPNIVYPTFAVFDSEAAKTTIAAAKLSPDRPLKIVTARSGYLPALAENLEFQLKNLGFPTELTIYDPTQEFLIQIVRPRLYDILLYEIELGSDIDLFPYYHSASDVDTGLNLSRYSSLLVDDLILAARTTMDPVSRFAKYESILKHWVDDAPAIGIYQSNLSYYINRSVRSFSEDNRLVYPSDRFADVQYWSSQQLNKNRTP